MAIKRVEGEFLEYAEVDYSGDNVGNGAVCMLTFKCEQPAEVGTNPDGSVWIKFTGSWEMAEVAKFLKLVLL